MNISSADDGHIVVFSISGSMDATSVDDFNDAWAHGFVAGRSFLFDLNGLEYVSSAGLRCFLGVGKACMSAKANLAFCSMGDMVADVFRITGFSGIFKVYATAEEAIAALG